MPFGSNTNKQENKLVFKKKQNEIYKYKHDHYFDFNMNYYQKLLLKS